MTPTQSASSFRFADVVIDLRRRRLTRDDRELALGKLTFDVLAVLAESWPETVTQEALARRVWAGRFATPETVAQRVKMLRQALGDDAQDPRYLRVIRGHGYQLIPEVEAIADAVRDRPSTSSESARAAGRRSARRWFPLTAGSAAVVALAVWAYLAYFSGSPTEPLTSTRRAAPHTIAVIPFRNLAEDADEYFVDGFSDALVSRLVRYGDVRLAGSASSYLFKNSGEDYRSIGQSLGVDYVLTGSVRKAGDELKIFAELVSTDDGYVVWNGNFDRSAAEIFDLQDEISRQAAGALGLSSVASPDPPAGGTDNLAAYDHFLRGQYLLMRFEQLDAALAELTEAVRLDPDFGIAYGVLAHAWRDAALDDADRVAEAVEQSRTMTLHAIEKAPGSRIAHVVMAEQHAFDKRWIEAHAAMRLAAELHDGMDDHGALFLLSTGQAREAVPAIESLAAAEPLLVIPQHWLAMAYDILGDHAEAVAHYEAAMRLPGEHGLAEGIHFMRQLARGEIAEPLTRLRANPAFGPHFARLDSLDDREAALAALRTAFAQSDGWSVNNFAGFSNWASYIGDPELAIESVRATLRLTPWYLPVIWLPVWQPTRADPAFKEFMIELRLPEYWRRHGWPEHCRPVDDDDFECA